MSFAAALLVTFLSLSTAFTAPKLAHRHEIGLVDVTRSFRKAGALQLIHSTADSQLRLQATAGFYLIS